MDNRLARWGGVVLGITILTLMKPCLAEFVAPGVKLVPLTDNGKSRAVAWAYHGDLVSYIYEVSDSQRQLMVMKSDGTDETKISPIGYPFFSEWSWRGDKLSYEFANSRDAESQSQVFVHDFWEL